MQKLRRVIAWLSAAFCFASFGMGQQNRYKVTGTVVNSITGEPIPRALVSGGGLKTSVLTDGSGKFEADNVPEGRVYFEARRPGYFELESIPGTTRVPVQSVDASHTSVEVKLAPAAKLRVRVVDAEGQPVESIGLQLTGRRMQDGLFQWASTSGSTTDDTGVASFDGLLPGTYLLRSHPRRLYVDANDLVVDGQHYPDLYAGAYYPGVPDRASAQQVRVEAGAHVELDMPVKLVSTYTVSGSVSPAVYSMISCVDEEGDSLSAVGRSEARTGTFRVSGVPTGTCSLQVESLDLKGHSAAASLPITVTAEDVTNVKLTLREPLPDIPIVVSGVPAAQAASRMNIRIMPRGVRSQTQVSMRYDADGSMRYVVGNPSPGSYRLSATGFNNVCVATMEADGVDLSNQDLVIEVDHAPAKIDVGLRTDCASLDVVVDGLEPGVLAFVLISGGPSQVQLLSTTGKLGLPYLSPGNYILYALTDASQFEYGKTELLKKLTGQQLTLEPSQKSSIHLKPQAPPKDETAP